MHFFFTSSIYCLLQQNLLYLHKLYAKHHHVPIFVYDQLFQEQKTLYPHCYLCPVTLDHGIVANTISPMHTRQRNNIYCNIVCSIANTVGNRCSKRSSPVHVPPETITGRYQNTQTTQKHRHSKWKWIRVRQVKVLAMVHNFIIRSCNEISKHLCWTTINPDTKRESTSQICTRFSFRHFDKRMEGISV